MTPEVEHVTSVRSPDDYNPLQELAHEFMRRWRLLGGVPLGLAVLAFLASFLVPKQYEGVAIFSPAEDVTSNLPGNLQSIAAQFGIAPGTPGYNVYYFAQVAQSREVLRLAASDTIDADSGSIAVMDLIEADGDTPAERLERGIRDLEDRLAVLTDDQADLVTLRVRGPSPASASALLGAILDGLNAVTTASIRSGGSAERRFAQAQADSAREALLAAENKLRDFLTANRSMASSPALQFEDARLRRQIQLRQDLYLGLVNQSEAAKLREVRNTPAISLIQPPQSSMKKVWPRRSVWALFGFIGAFTFIAAWLYVLRSLVRPDTTPARPSS